MTEAKETPKQIAARLRKQAKEIERLAGGGPASERAGWGTLTPDEAEERKQQSMRKSSDRLRRALRDIGPIPPCKNPERRARCEADTPLWLKTYLPSAFSLSWSPDHLKVIAHLDEVIAGDALFALGMPRGSGKTQLLVGAGMKAVFTGQRRYVVPIAATHAKAKRLVTDMRDQILADSNNPLLEDYPEFIVPMRKVNCDSRRCKDQTTDGVPTQLSCSPTMLDFGLIPGRLDHFAIIQSLSISSTELRGTHYTKNGEPIRPDLVLLDDVQTDKIAINAERVDELLGTIEGAVLGMAGPGKKISALACCTVFAPGDASDRLLDRQLSPQWQGERYKMLYALPARMDLWKEYRSVVAEHMQHDGDGSRGTEFYLAHRAEMDEGAVIAWPENVKPGDVSALQSAMNIFLFKPLVFASEYQNSPLEIVKAGRHLTSGDLVKRMSGRRQGIVPTWATKLTCGVDVQGNLLFWLVAAWGDDFTGSIIDYGTWPDQRGRRNYTLSDVLYTLQTELPGAAIEGQIHNGLTHLVAELMTRDFARDGGQSYARIDRTFVDTGYKSNVVAEYCRTSPYNSQIRPCKGRGIKATQTQWGDFPKRDGERLGFHWLEKVLAGRTLRSVQHDTNFWKSFLKERFLQSIGESGALTLYDDQQGQHAMLINHLTAEHGVLNRAVTTGVEIEEWTCKPNRDNHWFDALTMAAAAASFEGVCLAAQQARKEKASPRQKFGSFAEWQASKFGRQAR
jgi:hypothetical protein